MSTEDIYLKKCISDIEKRYSWGNSAAWTNYHFVQLATDIEKKTGKRISESTLKRIIGKKKTEKDVYIPQIYTKNTLAEFLGALNWENFCFPQNNSKNKAFEINNIDYGGKTIKKTSLLKRILSLFKPTRSIEFVCINSVSSVPYTAIFNYNISGIKEEVFMETGNGYHLPVPHDKKMITEFYSKAGVFAVRLLTKKNRILATTSLHNLSKAWQGGTSTNNQESFFTPFRDQSICREHEYLYTSPQNIRLQGIDYNSHFWTEYRYFEDFNADADNVSVSFEAKNDPSEGGKSYNDIQFILIGENGNINFRFIAPNAQCFVYLEFGEKIIDGRYNNLSVFTRNTYDWRTIRFINNNQRFEIWFENEKVYSDQYQQAIGQIKGAIIRFFGCGALKTFVMKNHAGIDLINGVK